VDLGIVIPLVVLPVLLIGAYVWYRRSLDSLRGDEIKPVSGVRLTAEALHRLDSPPWRVVYEIGGALGGVDHVVIGPPGIIAISTVMADRPDPVRLREASGTAQLVAEAAVERGPVDELARPSGMSCQLAARVFWGAPAANRPAFDEAAHGRHLVEGQRLGEWLDRLTAAADTDPAGPGSLGQSQIDLSWQAIVMGIGRPNPIP
jgi:hypothetical protein